MLGNWHKLNHLSHSSALSAHTHECELCVCSFWEMYECQEHCTHPASQQGNCIPEKMGIAPELTPKYEEVKSTQKCFGFVAVGILKIFFSARDFSEENNENVSGLDFCLLMDIFMTEARGLESAWHFPCLSMRLLH